MRTPTLLDLFRPYMSNSGWILRIRKSYVKFMFPKSDPDSFRDRCLGVWSVCDHLIGVGWWYVPACIACQFTSWPSVLYLLATTPANSDPKRGTVILDHVLQHPGSGSYASGSGSWIVASGSWSTCPRIMILEHSMLEHLIQDPDLRTYATAYVFWSICSSKRILDHILQDPDP